MKRRKKVVIVLPAYNAAKTIKKTIKDIPQNSYDDILLVDDASKDNTARIAGKLGIKVFIHPKNRGYGANQKTCYQQALKLGADVIVMLHPDYQYDPKILPSLTTPILYGYADVVLGSRILGDSHFGNALKGGMPLYKYVANKLLTGFQNMVFGMHLSEYHTGYRAFDKKVLNKIDYNKFSDNFVFDNQILIACIKKGYRFMEVPAKSRYFKEASSINLVNSVRYGLDVVISTINAKLSK